LRLLARLCSLIYDDKISVFIVTLISQRNYLTLL
jgi:hypothetical protein